MTRKRAAFARGVAAVLVLATAPAPRGAGAADVMSVGAAGGARIEWTGLRDSSLVPARADTSAAASDAWLARLADPARAATALHVLADVRAATGDSAGADSCWRVLVARRGVWQWDALQHVAAGLAARLGPAAADSVLAPADRATWTDAERAAWLERRARLRVAASDPAGAAEFARQLVLAYPGVVASSGRGVALLDSLAAASGDSLPLDVLRGCAEVDVFRGARGSAIGRLRRVLARCTPAERFAVTLRLAEVLRAARMPLAARAAADSAAARAGTSDERARAQLELARALRDAAKTDSALAVYARVAHGVAASRWRSTAWWEYAREAEDRGRYRVALAGFGRAVHLGGSRDDDARFQAGLMCVALGEPDSALAWWRHARGEGARFWRGLLLRSTDRAAGDSLLRELAVLPGYGFYRAAARETLGVRGWPEGGRAVALPDPDALPITDDVRALVAGGRAADAGELLSRWASGDLRTGALKDAPHGALLAAASLAFDVGRLALGTRLAERAFSAAANDSVAWAIVPWAYAPAYEPGVVRAGEEGIEPALLWALVRQESRFDPRARSRSDALGLTQLKRTTAADVARALRETPPDEAELLQPARSLRYGARYLAGLVRRFDGDVAVALAAYNAGPGTIRPDWRALLARGGDALYAELASNADSQDYVRRILGYRQAYRELRPTAGAVR